MTNETIATETTEAVGEFPIDELLSDGITNTPPSFVRAILKAASDPEVTSFAGGLPNPISFPQEKLLESMQRVVAERGPEAFQYSVTAGVPELRAWIADRYNHRFGTDYTEEDVLVTTGSQQVLDLLGKVLLDKGDGVIVEKPKKVFPQLILSFIISIILILLAISLHCITAVFIMLSKEVTILQGQFLPSGMTVT